MAETSKVPFPKVRVLGVDPGTRTLGYAVLDVRASGTPELLRCGTIRLPPKPLEVRLEVLFRDLGEIIRKWTPRVLALEDVFYGKNFRSVLKVGEARGVVALAAQLSGLELREYAPACVKRAATGNGSADKRQVQKAMARQLGLATPPQPADVSDALAVAFCHAREVQRGRAPSGGSRRLTLKFPRNQIPAPRPAVVRPSRRGGAAVRDPKLTAFLRSAHSRVFVGRRFRRSERSKRSGG